MRRVVVKLGGSSAHVPEFGRWIAALAGSALPLAIVPGGGSFADEVRRAQRRIGFSDAAAHAMAILAMEQFAHVVLDRDARLAPARSVEDFDGALPAGKVPVWMPSTLALAADDVPASWNVTSDSLAAWLAGRIGADALLLIKQSRDVLATDDVASLTAKGVVDPCLSFLLPAGVELRIACPGDVDHAAAELAAGRLPGFRIPAAPAARKAG